MNMPKVEDRSIANARIGGTTLDYIVAPPPARRLVNGLGVSFAALGLPSTVVQALASEFAKVADVLGIMMTREDAMIRELVALRAEVARLSTPPVELDLAALQTKTAATEGDRGPDEPPDEAA